LNNVTSPQSKRETGLQNGVEYRTAKKMTTAEMGRVVEIMMPTQHSEIAGA
jgi:hypothetical protein